MEKDRVRIEQPALSHKQIVAEAISDKDQQFGKQPKQHDRNDQHNGDQSGIGGTRRVRRRGCDQKSVAEQSKRQRRARDHRDQCPIAFFQ